ncbi:flagellar protein FlaG [Pseudomonas sp. LJDD11]|uniref:flagellar protein FlaG n=1 Tax=unclassified Pseudomonas TaxID=196821 RepID=UPI0004F8A4BA|nr:MULTISPECIES: flagellar protein FlaG [unclassified Pseudomonas]MCQ9424912.1 flagellar protein FlaG [Pseudomonas sp. LJDD11]BAP44168.1 flagellin FlaG [Pseudomonas sp. StFLB209]
MDMGVRLNLSYPAAKPASETVVLDKVAVKPPVVEAEASSQESKGSQHDDEKVKAAAAQIQQFLQSIQRNLEFSVDEDSGRVVVKVIASDTGLVVRQIPNEEVLKLAESLNDANSTLFKAEA